MRIPKAMFLMAINVLPVTYKMHMHTNKAWKNPGSCEKVHLQ